MSIEIGAAALFKLRRPDSAAAPIPTCPSFRAKFGIDRKMEAEIMLWLDVKATGGRVASCSLRKLLRIECSHNKLIPLVRSMEAWTHSVESVAACI